MGQDTPPGVEAELARLRRRAHEEELYPDDLRPLSTTELEYLVGQEQGNPNRNDATDRLNRNASRARVHLEHRRSIDLQEQQQQHATDLQHRQLIHTWLTVVLAVVAGLAGVWLGATVFDDDPPSPTPVVIVTTTSVPP